METFRELIVTTNLHVGIQKPDYTKQDRFYNVYSPEKFKLRPREDIYVDLKFDIQTPEIIQPWLNLLPSLRPMGMHVENDDCIENKTKDNTIHQFHILNRSFSYTVSIKKKQCIGYSFLLGERVDDKIITKYNLK